MRFKILAVSALICCSSAAALAAKLDEVACDGLKAERARLATEALKSDMAKGPEWAKTNLSKDRLREIEQLIGLEEGIAFRCPLPKPPPVQANAAKPGEAVTDTGNKPVPGGAAGLAGETPAAPIVTKPKKPASQAPASQTNGGGAPAPVVKKELPSKKDTAKKEPNAADSKPAAKPPVSNAKPQLEPQKPKAKVSDAYVPPPPGLGVGYAADEPPAVTAAPPAPAFIQPEPSLSP